MYLILRNTMILIVKYNKVTMFHNILQEMSTLRTEEVRVQITNKMDLAIISPANRWALYFKWAAVVLNNIRTKIKPLQVCN